jgi:hypothetical protein
VRRALLLAFACGDNFVPPDAGVPVADFPAEASPDLDLLFVVKTAPATSFIPQFNTTAVPALVDGFGMFSSFPNLHVGIVDSIWGRAVPMTSRIPLRASGAVRARVQVRAMPAR